jgi:hypothetical protein
MSSPESVISAGTNLGATLCGFAIASLAAPGRTLARATSRFGLAGLAFVLLKPISRPPLPALGHSRNRDQALDVTAIPGVDAKYVPDGETMSRSLDNPDLIPRRDATLDDQS